MIFNNILMCADKVKQLFVNKFDVPFFSQGQDLVVFQKNKKKEGKN